MKRTFFAALALFFSLFASAQDTLPNFSVKDLGKNRIQVSWINPFETVVQLNVQRSFDSLRNFRTIFSPQSPGLPQNGFVDTKAPAGITMYYRIYYVFSGGTYFFTFAKKPATGVEMPGVELTAEQLITIRLRETVIGQYNNEQYRRFRDSIMYQTKDTLFAVSPTEIVIKPYAGKEMWRASQYIFSGRDGLVTIKLPLAATRHYKVLFFEEDGTPLFEIGKVKEPSLTLDKANFIHAGWFLFDLYEDGVLKERNRFYISREF
jgi:hypothetical protein